MMMIGCSKKSPTPTPITPPTISTDIIDKSPKYSSINALTNAGFANRMFPGFYFTLEKASQYKLQINQKSLFDADYRFWDPSKCYLDYNGDGKLDMFAFLTNFKDAPFASNFGKILLVDDILGSTPKFKVVDANRRFMPRLKAVDLNKDGVNEVLFSVEEDHILINGTHGTPSSIQIATISKNGDIIYKQIGESVSIHGQAFGDIDNDGDLDILVWRSAYTNPNNEDLGSLPILYLNDGTNNFIKTNSFSQFIGLNSLIPIQSNGKRKSYAASTVDLFDVDGDGYLDILTSNIHTQSIFQSWDPNWEFNHPSTRIYWGNGTGFFDFLSRFSDLPVDYLQGLGIANHVNVSPLGFSYLDFDKDGDMDIVTTSTPGYGGYIIQLCENMGNRQFRDVTKAKIDVYSSVFTRNSQVLGAFPNFYELRMYDKDGDGDFDIVPDHVATWDIWQFPISQDLYWENTGGAFRIKK
jgi:hypothetical protein